MKSEVRTKKIDLIFLLVWPIIASFVSLFLNAKLFESLIIFYLIPSLIISFRIRKEIIKAAGFSLLAIPMYIFTETLGNTSSSWVIPTIFNFKVFGASVEGMLWGFITVYFIVMFYEYFLDKHITEKAGIKIKYLILLSLGLFSIFLIGFFGFHEILRIPYYYLLIGAIFVLIPIILEFIAYKKIITKFFITASYFFYFHFVYEILALKLGWWYFPSSGKFIGWISFLGVNFPIEELLFFIMFGVLATLSYFEFFDDDEK